MAMATVQATLTVNKKALRKNITSTLQTLTTAATQTQSQAIAARIFTLPVFRQCKSVSCYLSMPNGEVDTSSIVVEILHAGKNLFVPKIDQTPVRRMDMMKIYDDGDLRSLPAGVWGIKQPDNQWQGQRRLSVFDVESEALDLVLLPGVAFDRSLSRLGHGKGYYDGFISSYVANGRPRPLLVALALREQVLDAGEVPMGGHDWKMDMIVTPDEIIQVGHNEPEIDS